MNRRFLVNICQMYYEYGMSQQEIATKLNLSRVKISRSLKLAREMKIIKINIDYKGTFFELQKKVKDKFDLKDIIIVENSVFDDTTAQIQDAGAQYLNSRIRDNSTVAVGWGNTIRGLPNYMHKFKYKNVTFSPIIGGQSVNQSHMHSSTIASTMASATDAKSIIINAPALVTTLEERKTLVNNSHISVAIQKTQTADIAIFSLGNPSFSKSSIHSVQYFSDDELKKLKDNNVVCDFVSIGFLDEYGEKRCLDISNRTVGISLEDLLKIPTKICLVNGVEKEKSILAALYAKYVDVLVTDKQTAEFLISVNKKDL